MEDVPDPLPGPGDVVLEIGAAAICHSDIRVYLGQKHARAGVIPGHEIAGTVVAGGEAPKRRAAPKSRAGAKRAPRSKKS